LSIPDPGSRIPDLGSQIQIQQQKRGVQNFCLSYLFCSHKKHKIENFINFELVVKKKIWANLQRFLELSTQKVVIKLSKIWVWEPGSRIQGSKRHRIPDPGSGSAILVKSLIICHSVVLLISILVEMTDGCSPF